MERPPADLITFVPADGIRQLSRGSHPAETIARELARHWELEFATMLTRRGSAERQAHLPYARRRANVRRVFAAARSPTGAHILLVDDVYTTGSTVDAAASALRTEGARSVDVVTFARALRR